MGDEAKELWDEVQPWMCRWPSTMGVPSKHGMEICGKTIQPGGEFCAEHLTTHAIRKHRIRGAREYDGA